MAALDRVIEILESSRPPTDRYRRQQDEDRRVRTFPLLFSLGLLSLTKFLGRLVHPMGVLGQLCKLQLGNVSSHITAYVLRNYVYSGEDGVSLLARRDLHRTTILLTITPSH
jgi:hypothetical protein